jgi:hypothetical protein
MILPWTGGHLVSYCMKCWLARLVLFMSENSLIAAHSVCELASLNADLFSSVGGKLCVRKIIILFSVAVCWRRWRRPVWFNMSWQSSLSKMGFSRCRILYGTGKTHTHMVFYITSDYFVMNSGEVLRITSCRLRKYFVRTIEFAPQILFNEILQW